jgi:hypothetical protein
LRSVCCLLLCTNKVQFDFVCESTNCSMSCLFSIFGAW